MVARIESWLLSRGLLSPKEKQLGPIREKAINAIEDDRSDRAVAIVYCAIIEEALARCLCRFDVQKIAHKKFGSSGAFGDFATKIDLGALMGIYGTDTCKTLHTIRRIRNKFAHEFEADSFDSDLIRDLAKSLVFPNMLTFTATSTTEFIAEGETETLDMGHNENAVSTLRQKFTTVCRILLLMIEYMRPGIIVSPL